MPAASATTFVYVSNAGSQGISVLALAPGGALTPVETVAVPGPAQAGSTMPMSVSRDKKRLYVALRNEPYSAVTFAIDRKTGRLTPVGSGRLADSMAYIFAERGGKFLLGASYGGNKVAVAPIGVDGTVRAARQAVATKNAHCILADKTNTYVLHTSLGEDVVYQHKFNAKSGKLTPNDPSTVSVKAKAGPRHLTFSPDGKFVYLVNELDGSIYAFPWNARTGKLKKEIQIVSALPRGFAGKPWAADIHVTPDGKFLYASERTSSTLAAFRVDRRKGTLTAIGNFATEKQPRAFAIDSGGRYLFAVGQLSNSLTVYVIDKKSGELRKLKRYPMGENPNWIEIVDFSC